jgi:uncharacterized phage protein gp47/JayE
MTTISPVAPTISATGISAPGFSAILAYLTSKAQSIFGEDLYLGNDSQDGQMLGVIAQGFADMGAAMVSTYNSFSPATAQGNGLSSVVRINGLTRLVPSYSTAVVTVTGTANTPITNGQAKDGNGNIWALPASVTIPSAGTIDVTATCLTPGAIEAADGTIDIINTPVYGWQGVTNAAAAVAGQPVETDAALRIRQGQSVALPSQTIFEGIVGAIESVSGVTRVAPYENNTASTDGNGIPANTLCFVVEGGSEAAIQAAIASRIPPGIGSYGSASAVITDAVGSTRTIAYDPATPANIDVVLTMHALNGWSTNTQPIIAAAVAAYLSALPGGQNVGYTEVFVPAYLIGTQYAGTFKITAMTLAKNGGSAASADVTISFNEMPVGSIGNISFVMV